MEKSWKVGHGHEYEMMIWSEMLKTGEDLVHLEWADSAEEFINAQQHLTFWQVAAPMTGASITVAQIETASTNQLQHLQKFS